MACVYAGPKEVFDATEAAARVPYRKHDSDGTEHPESYFEKTDEFALESTHYLYQVGPLKDGSIVEVVRPDEHVFYGIRVAPQKGKKKSGK